MRACAIAHRMCAATYYTETRDTTPTTMQCLQVDSRFVARPFRMLVRGFFGARRKTHSTKLKDRKLFVS